jgi:peroxiredoxin Q/BCP
MVESYRVWGSKKFMGRQYMGIHRVTYLINESGRIEHIWPRVKPEEHPAEVLEFLTTKSAG